MRAPSPSLDSYGHSTLIPAGDQLAAGKFIARKDVSDCNLDSFNLPIRHSKTIQFGQRVFSLPYTASSDIRLCPVRALLRHLGTSKLPQGRPLFNFVESGKEIFFSHKVFMSRLKDILRQTGHPATEISCHSFRRGGASLAFEVGLNATQIKMRGDWRSSAYERYLFVSNDVALDSSRLLVIGAGQLALGK